MGRFLLDIMKTEDRGLVGITLDGREVLLSRPIQHTAHLNIEPEKTHDIIEYSDHVNRRVREVSRDFDNTQFVCLQKISPDFKNMYFEIYTERK